MRMTIMPRKTVDISRATDDLIKEVEKLDPEFNFSSYTDCLLREQLDDLVKKFVKERGGIPIESLKRLELLIHRLWLKGKQKPVKMIKIYEEAAKEGFSPEFVEEALKELKKKKRLQIFTKK